MINDHKKSRLTDLLSAHGSVMSLSQIPNGSQPGPCMILATMKSPHEAIQIQQKYGFQPFGYNSLIISEAWLSIHLCD